MEHEGVRMVFYFKAPAYGVTAMVLFKILETSGSRQDSSMLSGDTQIFPFHNLDN